MFRLKNVSNFFGKINTKMLLLAGILFILTPFISLASQNYSKFSYTIDSTYGEKTTRIVNVSYTLPTNQVKATCEKIHVGNIVWIGRTGFDVGIDPIKVSNCISSKQTIKLTREEKEMDITEFLLADLGAGENDGERGSFWELKKYTELDVVKIEPVMNCSARSVNDEKFRCYPVFALTLKNKRIVSIDANKWFDNNLSSSGFEGYSRVKFMSELIKLSSEKFPKKPFGVNQIKIINKEDNGSYFYSYNFELNDGRKYKISSYEGFGTNDIGFAEVFRTIGYTGTLKDFLLYKPPVIIPVITPPVIEPVVEPVKLTPAQLKALAEELRDTLTDLNSNSSSTGSSLKIGTAVTVTDNLRVRETASPTGKYVGTQKTGAKGTVVAGPLRAGGHTWFKVDYESGVDGWNAAGWLKQQVSYVGETTADNICVHESRTYRTGQKLDMVLPKAETGSVEVKAEFMCQSGQWRLTDAGDIATYSFVDTKSITKQDIDPNKAVRGDDYTTFIIRLKNGVVHTITTNSRMSIDNRDAQFRKTGYIGGITTLIRSAREIKGTTEQSQTKEATTQPEVNPEQPKSVVDPEKPKATSTVPSPKPAPAPVPKPPVPTPKPTPVPPATTTSYTLTDINTVTKKLVDPNKAAIDDEYTLYTITLKNKKVHQVKVFGRQQTSVRDANFKKTGYTGDVVKLMALAKAVTTPTPTLRPTATTTPTPVVKGATTDAYAEILETLNNISIMLEQNK